MKVAEPTGSVIFEEKQHFPRWLSIIMLSPILFTIGVWIAVFAGKNNSSEMWLALAVIIPIQLVMLYLFFNVQLEKIVTKNALYFRWTIFHKKYRVIDKKEIENIELRKPPLRKFGQRYVIGQGWMYNVSNNEVLGIHLRNGKKVFFGSADPFSFQRAVNEMISQTKNFQY